MLERIVRHRALAMAADLCEQRGWSLRVFGRGWEDHPRFGRFAGGVLEHGDDLRACYQAALVQLHASAFNVVHQRVMECALSGGLPIGVRSLAALPSLADVMARERITPDQGRPIADGWLAFETAGVPALEQHARLLATITGNTTIEPDTRIRAHHLERVLAHPRARGVWSYDAEWLLGQPAELMFEGARGLEQIVERARQDSDWRNACSQRIAASVRERATFGGLIDGMLGMMSDELGVAKLTPSA